MAKANAIHLAAERIIAAAKQAFSMSANVFRATWSDVKDLIDPADFIRFFPLIKEEVEFEFGKDCVKAYRLWCPLPFNADTPTTTYKESEILLPEEADKIGIEIKAAEIDEGTRLKRFLFETPSGAVHTYEAHTLLKVKIGDSASWGIYHAMHDNLGVPSKMEVAGYTNSAGKILSNWTGLGNSYFENLLGSFDIEYQRLNEFYKSVAEKVVDDISKMAPVDFVPFLGESYVNERIAAVEDRGLGVCCPGLYEYSTKTGKDWHIPRGLYDAFATGSDAFIQKCVWVPDALYQATNSTRKSLHLVAKAILEDFDAYIKKVREIILLRRNTNGYSGAFESVLMTHYGNSLLKQWKTIWEQGKHIPGLEQMFHERSIRMAVKASGAKNVLITVKGRGKKVSDPVRIPADLLIGEGAPAIAKLPQDAKIVVSLMLPHDIVLPFGSIQSVQYKGNVLWSKDGGSK